MLPCVACAFSICYGCYLLRIHEGLGLWSLIFARYIFQRAAVTAVNAHGAHSSRCVNVVSRKFDVELPCPTRCARDIVPAPHLSIEDVYESDDDDINDVLEAEEVHGQCLGPDDDAHQRVFSVNSSTLSSTGSDSLNVNGATLSGVESNSSGIMLMTSNNIARIERMRDLTDAYLMADHRWQMDQDEDARVRRDTLLVQLNALISSPSSTSSSTSTTDSA